MNRGPGGNKRTEAFLASVDAAMASYFGADTRRINHARKVTGYAAEMLDYVDADPALTLTAALLHDIGIPEAERKHGASAGKLQELEGPPVAKALLQRLEAPDEFITLACELVGAHHTPGGVDSPEFRILWDADALVNLEEVVPGKDPEEVRAILDRSMVTEPGYRRALALFIP